MSIFFTSDTHFGHKNIIQFANRPCANLDDMHQMIIEKWNAIVTPDDTVYHLGDLSFTSPQETNNILLRLNGHKVWIFGNHDKKLRNEFKVLQHFEQTHDLLTVRIEHQPIILCHYPMLSWEGMAQGSWHLHGHCHGNLPDYQTVKRTDVGVDCNSLAPFSFSQIKRIMDKRVFVPVDHHGR